MAARVNRGRQRIDIRRIENESQRHVTFSKRRTGAFKKASELCILTGAEMAVIVKSPANNTFTFGHPSVEAIGNRYLLQNFGEPANIDVVEPFMETIRNIRLDNLSAEYTALKEELLEHTKKAKVLNMMARDNQAEHRHKKSLASMSKDEMDSFKKDLLVLHNIVTERYEVMQQGQAHQMQQNSTMEEMRRSGQYLPPIVASVGSFFEGSSSTHGPIHPDVASSSTFWRDA